ncbi:hypothetical protein [Herpetosiphon geysericola]|uniref:Uncharacterized protein n=1 Tax=Herpetosiphon geysericola TaxID=70996 RepID=A0A0P6Y2P6_9CHLR|nr:hypothetical protein [Herpetosiphon geysericola]KPL86142.1 hypothetical protein SE18_14890 [Herpetosiphon geysericola]
MQTIDTIHIRRPSMQAFAPYYPVPTQTFPISAAPISPLRPTTKIKKNRKAKKPQCTCPSCQFGSETGAFYCLNLSEWGVYSSGQLLGYRSTYNEADSLMRQHLYTSLTKAAA